MQTGIKITGGTIMATKAALESILAEIREKTKNFDGNNYHGFLAVEVSLKDINEVFYVEVKEGKLSIEPFEYNDRQAKMIISSSDFVKMINGKLNSVTAYLTGKLKIEGNIEKCKEMAALFGGKTD
jgi:putative sterol carrier protein